MRIKSYKCYSLLSLACFSTIAQAELAATAPSLEGGVTASIGTFYAVPSTQIQGFAYAENGTDIHILEADPQYDFGWEASLGYVFENTANSIELLYRGLDSDNTNSYDGNIGLLPPDGGTEYDHADIKLKYRYNAVDLMVNQFLDIGTHVQMRFMGGLAYVDLKQEQSTYLTFPDLNDTLQEKSTFNGWGPRLGVDTRYDFGQGFGVVGGGSVAYFLGDLDVSSSFTATGETLLNATDDNNNYNVTNLRANLGIDYVYFFDNQDRSTAGIELGYLVDYYRDAARTMSAVATDLTTSSVSFSGPYLLVKGAF